LLSKARKHYVTLSYKDADGAGQAAVFEFDKNDIRSVLAVFKTKTGKEITYQDDDAREKMGGGKSEKTDTEVATASHAQYSADPKTEQEVAPYSAGEKKVHRLYVVVDHSKLSAQLPVSIRTMSEEFSPFLISRLRVLMVAEGLLVEARGFPPPVFDDAQEHTAPLVRKVFNEQRDAAIGNDIAAFSPDAVLRIILTKVSPGWNFHSGDIRRLEYEVTLQEPNGQSLLWQGQASNRGASGWGSSWKKSFVKMAAQIVDGLKAAKLI
jgi:hypothetical protein